MTDKKKGCGCGCIGQAPVKKAPKKEKRNTKQSK